jgi:Tryptophan/tyrosine permease family
MCTRVGWRVQSVNTILGESCFEICYTSSTHSMPRCSLLVVVLVCAACSTTTTRALRPASWACRNSAAVARGPPRLRATACPVGVGTGGGLCHARRLAALRCSPSGQQALQLEQQQQQISNAADGAAPTTVAAPRQQGNILTAAALVAGTTVGGGFLGLPHYTAPLGWATSSAMLAASWAYLLANSLLLSTLCCAVMKRTG